MYICLYIDVSANMIVFVDTLMFTNIICSKHCFSNGAKRHPPPRAATTLRSRVKAFRLTVSLNHTIKPSRLPYKSSSGCSKRSIRGEREMCSEFKVGARRIKVKMAQMT